MTIDQRGSSTDRDRVPELIPQLDALTSARFERSVGDEVQGVVQQAGEVVEVALNALRSGHWYVGIGVGEVRLGPAASPREGAGSGFVGARKAVEHAKVSAGQVPLSVMPGTVGPRRGGLQEGNEAAQACANAEAVLRLLGRLVQERTEAQWRVVDKLRSIQGGPAGSRGKYGSQKQAATELGITEQSVSRAVLRSGWQEEWAARPAAAMLLEHAHSLAIAREAAVGQAAPREGDR